MDKIIVKVADYSPIISLVMCTMCDQPLIAFRGTLDDKSIYILVAQESVEKLIMLEATEFFAIDLIKIEGTNDCYSPKTLGAKPASESSVFSYSPN